MTNLAVDTFNRADQSDWGNASDGQVWANVGGPGSYRILSNRGHIGNFNNYTINRLGSGTTADIDAEVSINLGDSSLNGAGIAWRVADINNGYRLVTFDNSIYLDKYIAGVRTNITNVFIGFSNADQLRMRVQHIGSACKVKLWNLSGSEPGSWAIDVTENSISSAGYFGLISDLFGGTGVGEVQYYDFTATDGATGVDYTLDVSDDALATDITSGALTSSQSESSAASDAQSGQFALSMNDVSAGSDSVAGQHTTATSDNATASETITVAFQFLAQDQSSATETRTFSTVLSASDSATTTDTFDFNSPVTNIPTLVLAARSRDGIVKAQCRDGKLIAKCRDGILKGRAA